MLLAVFESLYTYFGVYRFILSFNPVFTGSYAIFRLMSAMYIDGTCVQCGKNNCSRKCLRDNEFRLSVYCKMSNFLSYFFNSCFESITAVTTERFSIVNLSAIFELAYHIKVKHSYMTVCQLQWIRLFLLLRLLHYLYLLNDFC